MVTDFLWILEDKKPVPCKDVEAWATWMAHPLVRIVSLSRLGSVEVSTVFLGISFLDPPLLFETMVFGGPNAGRCSKSYTWEEAEAEHRKFLASEFAEL